MTAVMILVTMTTVIDPRIAAVPVRRVYRTSGQAPAPAPAWTVGTVGPGDRAALEALFAACSPDTVRLRFFGRLRAFPPEYLAAVLAGRPAVHDAVVAYRGADRAHPAGMAGIAAATPADGLPPMCAPATTGVLGVLVADAWQRQGAGAAMTGVRLDRARARGVRHVLVGVLPGRSALLAVLARRLTPVPGAAARTGDGLSAVYRLGN